MASQLKEEMPEAQLTKEAVCGEVCVCTRVYLPIYNKKHFARNVAWFMVHRNDTDKKIWWNSR